MLFPYTTLKRLDYLKGANLFADDVKKEHDAAAERNSK